MLIFKKIEYVIGLLAYCLYQQYSTTRNNPNIISNLMSDNTPTIAIWSNDSAKRAWSSTNSNPIEYQYTSSERPITTDNDPMISYVTYQGTKFHYNNINCLVENNSKQALYFIKEKLSWKCVGLIEKTEYIDDYNFKFTIRKTEYSKVFAMCAKCSAARAQSPACASVNGRRSFSHLI